jgi:hypothetical protein
MKKVFIFLAFISLTSLAFAQNQAPSAKVKSQIAVLKNADLNLSEVQISRITTVLIGEEQNAIRAIKSVEGNKSLLEKRLQALKDSQINNIKGAMTPQQVDRFDALKLADKL